MFLTLNINTGFVTIVIAHVMFTVSYVVVTVKARLEGMDRHIEEAAMDLGATEWVTFRKITLPMIAPGVAAAAMLAAAISFDDYVDHDRSTPARRRRSRCSSSARPARACRPRSTCWRRCC